MKKFASPLLAIVFVLAIDVTFRSTTPVVIGMRAVSMDHSGTTIDVRVTGWKIRSCDVVRGSAVGWFRENKIWHEAPFEFADDLSPDSTRPIGYLRQHFGVWRWSNIPAGARKVRLTLQHDCNGKIRTTIAGVFDITPKK